MNALTGEEVWLPLLSAAHSRMIAITGSGGKTSLLYYLANVLLQQGERVVISLTTKMFHPNSTDHQVLLTNSVDSLIQAAGSAGSGLLTVARAIDSADSRKLTGFSSDWLNQAQAALPNVFFLVEADGSAGKPLKGYLPHEPVIPSATGVVIIVVGMDVVNKPLNDLHVHRAAVASRMSGRKIDEAVTPDVLVSLLSSPAGYCQGIPATAKTVFFLNKAEDPDTFAVAHRIADRLFCLSANVVIGSVQARNFLLRNPAHASN